MFYSLEHTFSSRKYCKNICLLLVSCEFFETHNNSYSIPYDHQLDQICYNAVRLNLWVKHDIYISFLSLQFSRHLPKHKINNYWKALLSIMVSFFSSLHFLAFRLHDPFWSLCSSTFSPTHLFVSTPSAPV